MDEAAQHILNLLDTWGYKFEENVKWMPASNKLYFTQKASDSSIAGRY